MRILLEGDDGDDLPSRTIAIAAKPLGQGEAPPPRPKGAVSRSMHAPSARLVAPIGSTSQAELVFVHRISIPAARSGSHRLKTAASRAIRAWESCWIARRLPCTHRYVRWLQPARIEPSFSRIRSEPDNDLRLRLSRGRAIDRARTASPLIDVRTRTRSTQRGSERDSQCRRRSRARQIPAS